MKIKIFILLFYLGISFANAQLIKNDFFSEIPFGEWRLEQYPEKGATFEEYVWKEAYNTQADVPLRIVKPLEYPNFVESGKGKALRVRRLPKSTFRTFGYALTNDNKYVSGTYYVAFLMQGHKRTIAGDRRPTAILILNGRHSLKYPRVAVCIKATEDRTAFQLGVSASEAKTSIPAYSSEVCEFDKTYLVILKYNMNNGNIDLFLNPEISENEPETSEASTNNNDLVAQNTGIRAITLRQRSNHTYTIGGFRFAESWKSAIGLE